MILVISKQEDTPTIELITKKLEAKGESFFVLDTTDLHNRYFSIQAGGGNVTLEIDASRLSFKDIKSVWVRRPFKAVDSKSSALDAHLQTELQTLAKGMVAIFKAHGIFILNEPHDGALAANKVVQWDAFRTLDIASPATRFSNVLNRVKPGSVVVKQLANKSFTYADSEFILPTKILEQNEIDALKKTPVPPLLLQNLLGIDYEVRATVVGRKVFAARIDYDSATTKDYRLLFGQNDKISYKPYDLPADAKNDCLKIMDHFGLHFGCIDFAVDKAGKHWVLELNPNGQWGWIEDETGLPIADAIADTLVHPPVIRKSY